MVSAAAGVGVSVDLTPIITGLIALIGVLAGAGYLLNRSQRRKMLADAALAEAQVPMTHAQYENLVSEATIRVQQVSDMAINRLEKELAAAKVRIAELETELERVKSERTRLRDESRRKEEDLYREIIGLRDRVIDLERRLHANGFTERRQRYTNLPHNPDPGSERQQE